MSKSKRSKRVKRIRQWSALTMLMSLGVILWVLVAAREKGEPVAAARAKVEELTSVLNTRAESSRIAFEDVTDECGLDGFRHFPGERGALLPEDMGSGVAVSDYDGDGREDVYLVNFTAPLIPDPAAPIDGPGRNALFRNESIPGRIRFVETTPAAGVGLEHYGMGACWGDYDNDGRPDLYVTGYGPNCLFRNDGDGTFTDVTEDGGVGGAFFSTGCSWGDYNLDGHIDLYVTNYVDFVYKESGRVQQSLQNDTETPYTLNPSSYEPVANQLYRNNGDGTFTDVASELNVADTGGRSLGALWVDMDLDGRQDLYVANDVSANAAFRNTHSESGPGFEDIAAKALIADYRGAMGLATDDYDRDGDFDLLVTHWLAQENALYVNNLGIIGSRDDSAGTGRGAVTADTSAEAANELLYFDEADLFGLGQSSLDMVGWACGFADFDNDGWSDLWIVNGSTLNDPADPTRLKEL